MQVRPADASQQLESYYLQSEVRAPLSRAPGWDGSPASPQRSQLQSIQAQKPAPGNPSVRLAGHAGDVSILFEE